ncbi:DUF421 domain-containing protein [Aggregatilinea lenta]|uniref:DUF421 domain-containing protein n=1 Tax=Aggregatilinea lenta TaxID=913108 RepID=UPI000E5A83CC|nr:YetF domain-containing protein [Aggregatilinea lenta]
MFFDSWAEIGRTVIVGVLAYAMLVVMLRVSGKRTLSKMNAFDLIVTVALGSTLATILLSKDVALAEGLTAFVTLILLQYVVAWLSVRSKAVRELVKSTPRLLFYRQQFLDDALRTERVTREEVYAAIRAQGLGVVEQVEAVVLETDGSFTVLTTSAGEGTSTLKHVRKDL